MPEFQSLIPNNATVLIISKECSPDDSRGYAVWEPHPGIRLLGRVVLNSLNCCCSNLSECTQRPEAVIPRQTFKAYTIHGLEPWAPTSPELSGSVQMKTPSGLPKVDPFGSGPRVLLPGVIPANKTSPSSIQKQSKVLFFDDQMEKCKLELKSTCFFQTSVGRAAL